MALTREVIRIDVEEHGTDVYDRLDKDQRKLERGTQATDGALKGVSSTLLNLGSAASIAMASAAALRTAMVALAQPVGLAISFEKEFALVRTLGDGIGDDLKRSLLDLAASVPQTAGDITKAAYNAISAGIDPSAVTDFLKSASAAAVAGDTDLTTVVSTLTTAVNAFRDDGLTAARAADVLFGTVKAGVTNFQELAQSLPQGAALAGLGVSFEELNATAATLTKTLGVPTAQAFTRVNALVRGLTTAGGPMAKALAKLGVKADIATLKHDGLAKVLARVQKATQGNVEIFGALSRRSEATQALIGLLGSKYEVFRETLDRVKGSTGETAKATAIMRDTTQGAIDSFKALSEGVLRDLGTQALPLVNDALKSLSQTMAAGGPEMVRGFASVIASVAQLVAMLGKAAAAYGEFVDLVGTGREDAAAQARIKADRATVERLSKLSVSQLAALRERTAAQRDASFTAEGAAVTRQRAAQAGGLPRLADVGDAARAAKGLHEQTQSAVKLLRLIDAADARRRSERVDALVAGIERTVTSAVSAIGAAAAGAVASTRPGVAASRIGVAGKGRKGGAAAEAEASAAKNHAALVAAAEAQVDARLQAARTQAAAQEQLDSSLTARRLALIEDEGTRRLALMASQHQMEMDAARARNLDTTELARVQADELARVSEDVAARRRAIAAETVEAERRGIVDGVGASISALQSLEGALAGAGKGSSLFRAGLLLAEATYHGTMAASEGAEAATSFAALNPVLGLAHTAAAIQHAAVAIRAGSDAVKLGGRGGGGSGAAAAAAQGRRVSAPARRGPSPSRGGESGGKTVINIHLNDLMLPPDPSSLERMTPALMEAMQRAGLTSGLAGMPGADAFSAA